RGAMRSPGTGCPLLESAAGALLSRLLVRPPAKRRTGVVGAVSHGHRAPPDPPGGVRRSAARACPPSLAGSGSGEAAGHEYGWPSAAASPAVAGTLTEADRVDPVRARSPGPRRGRS